MTIFICPTNFKIRKKADAETFLNMADQDNYNFGHFQGEVYWHDDEYDYCLSAKTKRVSWRPISMRGNIFNPYFDDGSGYIDLIWDTRKYINDQLFTHDKW